MSSRKQDVYELLTENCSVGSYRQKMLDSYDLWCDFEYLDWINYLKYIQENPLKLYAFLPFITQIIGIEILHEFRALNNVKKSILEYVNATESSHYYNITNFDLQFFAKHKNEIKGICNSIGKLSKQGAIPVEEYKLHIRIKDEKCVKRYAKTITRKEFSTVSSERIINDKYLISSTNYKNN